MDEHDDDKALVEALSTFKADLKKTLSSAMRAGKACEGLASASALRRLADLDKHLPSLRDADLSAFGLEDRRQELVAQLTTLRERLKSQTRMAVLGELTRQGQGIEVSLLTETPLIVLVAPLTVELDLEAGTAKVLYAREVVGECEPEARAILAARQKAMDHIRKLALDSAAFFDLVQRAYQTTLQARGLQPGERVDLVDLLGPLALLGRAVNEWRRLTPNKGLSPYPRYLLAYQLQRLQREGLLTHDGLRLELGAATIGSTKNKRDVLFIPTTHAEGQYYLSVRLVPA